MPTTIDQKKLIDLRAYFSGGGSDDFDAVAAQIGTKDEQVVSDYVEALKEQWPEEFDPNYSKPETVPPPKPAAKKAARNKPAPSPAAQSAKRIVLVGENNSLMDLELVRESESTVAYRIKREKELVKIILHGEVHEIDLIELREHAAKPGAMTFDRPAVEILRLAELAKA